MKSLMMNDHELHKKLKLLSVQLGRDMIELVEEAIKELIERYQNEQPRRENN